VLSVNRARGKSGGEHPGWCKFQVLREFGPDLLFSRYVVA
jgi:hypothetical protein